MCLVFPHRSPSPDAILGATKKVPTVDGDVDFDIKEGTQPGSKTVLRGKGERIHGGSSGDGGGGAVWYVAVTWKSDANVLIVPYC